MPEIKETHKFRQFLGKQLETKYLEGIIKIHEALRKSTEKWFKGHSRLKVLEDEG